MSTEAPYKTRKLQRRKVCNGCKKEKAITRFHFLNKQKGYYQPVCKRCQAARDRMRKRTTRRPQTEAEKLVAIRRVLWSKYQLTYERYVEMLEEQHYLCSICDRPEDPRYRMAVDHDHDTEEVRGLLCRKCNTGLGAFDDDPDFLAAAEEYLRRFKQVKAA